jgi:hypothetical protein
VAAAVLTACAWGGGVRAGTAAQRLVDEFVREHPEVVELELSVSGNGGCRTVAATAREEVGTMCGLDELGPMQTGKPRVQPPTRHDPAYDITQALHDANGELVGAAGMSLRADDGAGRDAMLSHAKKLLRKLEGRIASKESLLARSRP